MHVASYFLLFGLLVSAFWSASASPLPEDQPNQYEELEIFGRQAGDGELVRLKRGSCDLFDVLNPGNTVCAAHCIWLGNRGGKCVDTVCHCRK